jgi:hypothetical protein
VLGLRRAVRLQLGELHERLGRPAEAAALYREALRLAPHLSADRAGLEALEPAP